jgi:hypothetical protein
MIRAGSAKNLKNRALNLKRKRPGRGDFFGVGNHVIPTIFHKMNLQLVQINNFRERRKNLCIEGMA